MIVKINKNGIISDTIQKFDGEKYLTPTDFGFDEATNIPETLSNVIDAQALAETAALNAIEAKSSIEESVETMVEEATNEIQTVVSEIKEETLNAQSLAELAAVNAIETEQSIQTRATEIATQAVEEATTLAVNAKNLAEVAAVNALEAERNVQARANEIVEEATSQAVNAKNLAETAAMNVQARANEIVEEATSQAVNAKNLSETAAVNALEAERNVTDLKNELQEKFDSGKFVIETYTSNDGLNWYRKWSDGYIEQSATLTMTQTQTSTTFLTPFTKVPQVIMTRISTRGDRSYDNEIFARSITKTGFTYAVFTGNMSDLRYYAFGF